MCRIIERHDLKIIVNYVLHTERELKTQNLMLEATWLELYIAIIKSYLCLEKYSLDLVSEHF